MKSKWQKTILLVLLLPLLILNVDAASIDPAKSGSITGLNTFGDKVLKDNKISIYKIANIDSDGEFTYTKEFIDANYQLNGLSSSQLNTLSNNIDNYITTNKIKETESATTDANGRFEFYDLTTGLYLVKSDKYIDGDYEYKSMSLISLPNYNEFTNEYMYDIVMVTKIDTKFIGEKNDDNNKNNNNNNSSNSQENIPNTYDRIYIYIGLFLVAIIGVALVVYYISRSKRSEKNEKNINNN